MQILLCEDLEHHRDRDDRHDLRGGAAEIDAENNIRDVRSNHGEAETCRQRDAEQQLGAFAEMRAQGGLPLIGEGQDGERKERGSHADRRHHQRLPDQIEARDVFSGIRGANQIGDHEPVSHTGNGEQGQRNRQRQTMFRRYAQRPARASSSASAGWTTRPRLPARTPRRWPRWACPRS